MLKSVRSTKSKTFQAFTAPSKIPKNFFAFFTLQKSRLWLFMFSKTENEERLTLNMFHTFLSVSIANFEQVLP